MNWNNLAPTICAGVVTLAVIVSVTMLLLAGKKVPTEFFNLIQIMAGATVGSSVNVIRRR